MDNTFFRVVRERLDEQVSFNPDRNAHIKKESLVKIT